MRRVRWWRQAAGPAGAPYVLTIISGLRSAVGGQGGVAQAVAADVVDDQQEQQPPSHLRRQRRVHPGQQPGAGGGPADDGRGGRGGEEVDGEKGKPPSACRNP